MNYVSLSPQRVAVDQHCHNDMTTDLVFVPSLRLSQPSELLKPQRLTENVIVARGQSNGAGSRHRSSVECGRSVYICSARQCKVHMKR